MAGWGRNIHDLKPRLTENSCMLLTLPHHYRPQHSYGKVMFLHMSVILSTGGCVSEHALGQAPPGQTSRADTPQIATAAGRYASYWKAFLLDMNPKS